MKSKSKKLLVIIPLIALSLSSCTFTGSTSEDTSSEPVSSESSINGESNVEEETTSESSSSESTSESSSSESTSESSSSESTSEDSESLQSSETEESNESSSSSESKSSEPSSSESSSSESVDREEYSIEVDDIPVLKVGYTEYLTINLVTTKGDQRESRSASSEDISLYCKDEDTIISIDHTNLSVTGLSSGQTTLVISWIGHDVSVSKDVEVIEDDDDPAPLYTYSIEIDESNNISTLKVGDHIENITTTLITQDDMGNEIDRQAGTIDDVELVSTNTTVLSVSGLSITALSVGEATLTATWISKEVTSSPISVEVIAEGSDIPYEPTYRYDIKVTNSDALSSLVVEDEIDLSVLLYRYTDDNTDPDEGYPKKASEDEVSIDGYDKDIIDVNGLRINAKAQGETSLYVKWEEYAKTDPIPVYVEAKVEPEPEPVYDNYVLAGTFEDASWEGRPNEDSKYYLGYTVGDSSTMLWQDIEVTTPASGKETYAQFRVISVSYDQTQGFDTWTTIAGYEAIGDDSTGVYGEGNDDNIQILWNATYSITIDLTGDTPYIKVTLLSSNTTYAYVLYGDFLNERWNTSPTSDSVCYLGYEVGNDSSKYWDVTISTSGEPTDDPSWGQYTWDASFYVIDYGDYDTLIAGASNLSSSSTGQKGTNGDNITLEWNTTYEIIIDCTSSNPQISVNLINEQGETEEKDFDAGYALYGDFEGENNWNPNPTSELDSYLGYYSEDPSSKVWTRLMKVPEGDFGDYDPWEAGFRITTIGSWESISTVAGFDSLDIDSSTGVESWTDDDNNIKLTHWDANYLITIDLSNDNGSIVVTYLGEEEEDNPINIDSYYTLYGAFDGSTWDVSPDLDSTFALPYDSSNNESRYWQRTVTTASGLSYSPGFRITEYGSETLVAGYSNFTISGNASLTTPDNDSNIRFSTTVSTTYDITIDMRSSGSWTINIDNHVDSFDGYVNGLYDGSSKEGGSSEPTQVDDEFIMGVDLSSIQEVESASLNNKFYDYDGNQEDIFTILKDAGVNYIRIRLWNNPYDENGNSFQGGGNDVTTDIEIAKRAVAAGMGVCLDFHYSDFWADPASQVRPREWQNLEDYAVIETAASWTTSVLTQFKEAGCEPTMVQVGNETNGIKCCGFGNTSSPSAYQFLSACANAVRAFNPEIEIVCHLAASLSATNLVTYFTALKNQVDFDILGLSYYTYLHGDMNNLDSILSALSSNFPSKKICIMEYSYGYTTSWAWDNDGRYGSMNNTFNDWYASEGGYEASVTGQAQCIYDTNQAIAKIDNGIGSFYWEPAWISNNGTSWASSYSMSYYQTYVDSSATESWFGTTSWSNQALFDFDGKAMDSLKVFNYIKNL